MINKKDIIGISVLVFILVFMLWGLYEMRLEKTGSAIAGLNYSQLSNDCSENFVKSLWNSVFLESSDDIKIKSDLNSSGCTNYVAYKKVNNDSYILSKSSLNNASLLNEPIYGDVQTVTAVKITGNDELIKSFDNDSFSLNKTINFSSGDLSDIFSQVLSKYLLFFSIMMPSNQTMLRAVALNDTNQANSEYFSTFRNNIVLNPQDWSITSTHGLVNNYDAYAYNKNISILNQKNGTQFIEQFGGIIYLNLSHNGFLYSYFEAYTCNNNSICEINENVTTCPNDCLCTPGESRSCYGGQGICSRTFQRCDNTSRNWSVCIGPAPVNETCNSMDDDCDGHADEGFDRNNDGEINESELFDYDDDGYFPIRLIGSDANCTGYNSEEYDCDDTNSSIHPGAKEKLNGVDDDCDGSIDNNITIFNYSQSIERIDLGILKKEGSKAFLRANDWATFKLGNIFGKIEVRSISNSSAVITVSTISNSAISSLPDSSLSLNQVNNFDLDKDGKNEISISADSIVPNFKVSLTVKDISEQLSPPVILCNNNGSCDSGETEQNCPIDCKVVVLCDNDGICDPKETINNCFNDCKPKEEPIVEQPAAVQPKLSCNNNTKCESWENVDNCPNDCKPIDYKKLGLYALAVFLFLTITSGGVVIKHKINPYRIRKKMRKSLVKLIASGYSLDNIAYYLANQKTKPVTAKKSLKYSADFMALKQAIAFYLAQGHKEDEIKEICKKNKWSRGITKDAFNYINEQNKNIANTKKNNLQFNPQKYQINNFK